MKNLVFICGLYNIGFVVFHLLFWRIFGWKRDLKQLTFANRAIMQILNIQLTYYFLFVAVLCFLFPVELVTLPIGRFILGATAIFWLIRTIQQFIFLRANHYAIHLLTVLFLCGTVLFSLPLVF